MLAPVRKCTCYTDAAEEAAGRASLAEAEAAARAAGVSVVTRMERGKPEQVIVAVAREVQAALVAIRARQRRGASLHWARISGTRGALRARPRGV